MTYRELERMADGHQRSAWTHTLAVSMGFVKGPAGLVGLIPERYRERPRPKTKEEEDAESAYAFAALEGTLKTLKHQWGK